MSGLRQDLEELLGAGELTASIATVDEDGVDVEGKQVMLKVTLQPSGTPRTVRLGHDYVGPGFGIYTLPIDGDEFLIVFPRDGGVGVAVKRLNNDIDNIPDELRDLKDVRPVLLVHASGWKFIGTDEEIRLDAGDTPVVVEGSDVLVESGDIKLGDDSAIALANENLKTIVANLVTKLNTDMEALKLHTNTIMVDPTLAAIGGYTGPDGSTITTKVKGS